MKKIPSQIRKFCKCLKWLKHLFVTLHFLLLSTIFLGSAALYIAFRPDGLEIVNTYFLEPFDVHYTHAEGSLITGFTLYNVSGTNLKAKHVSLQYNLTQMLKGDHTIDKIHIDGLQLNLNDFMNSDSSPWPFPTFKLTEIEITNLQLISSYPLELDIHATNGSYDGNELQLSSIKATIKSQYASGAIAGKVHNNSLTGEGIIYPNETELAPYSGKFTTFPQSLHIQIHELSDKRAILHTLINHLNSKQDPAVMLEGGSLDFIYQYSDDYFDINASYLIHRLNDSMQTKQHLHYNLSGKTSSEFDGIITSAYPLPSNALHGEFTDDTTGVNGKLTLDGSTLILASTDYNHFTWSFRSEHQNLSFNQTLPEFIRSSPLSMQAKGNYTLSTNTLGGSLDIIHDHALFNGIFSTQDNHHTLKGDLTLPPDALLWKNWKQKPPEHLALSLDYDNNTTQFHIDGNDLALSGTLNKESLRGSGNYMGAFFDLTGTLGTTRSEVFIDTVIPSLFASASKFQSLTLYKGEYYDAEIHAKTHISMDGTLRIKSDIDIPWYATVLDSQRAFGGTDGKLSLEYHDGNLTIEQYRLEIANHPLFSDKPSYLHFTPKGELIVDKLWIYDSLHLSGIIAPDLSASLHLLSDQFTYHGPEGTVHAAADITYTRDAEALQNISGSLSILDAEITYLPLQQFKVMDDDIIIVQDVRPPSSIKLAMNVHITAKGPIHYKTKELDMYLAPDITLWKEPTDPIQILGMVTIPSGNAKTGGKQFEIKPSEIYFGGDLPLNPYLNLTIGYEVDFKKILIYVTHTLEAPIFLFSSDPVMTQNDIMSYILFGAPSTSTTTVKTDSSATTARADATNFMLGAGLKGLINGATGIQIDTMNILTTQQGGMGFEVGARLNKNLRVLYKNNSVSSVLIQYNINRWLRLDADIHELGQGINAVYVKDFRDILPHNEPLKK
ncbi:MAG: translocation/assembly module TamB domain-containing protein [Sulfuricurvum sp.]|nr:translocation/assembly module TamB domain-containing protein [Sulfuricurvum sp.]